LGAAVAALGADWLGRSHAAGALFGAAVVALHAASGANAAPKSPKLSSGQAHRSDLASSPATNPSLRQAPLVV
jgi:hypothetical protein